MQNPSLFEAEGFGYESQFEDSSELYEMETEYENEMRRRDGRFQRGGAGSRQYRAAPAGRRPSRRYPPRPKYPVAYPVRPRYDVIWPDRPPVEANTECVRLVQRLLNRQLGLTLPVDGIMSVETRSAIRSFDSGEGSTAAPNLSPPPEAPVDDQPHQQGLDAGPAQDEYGTFEIYEDETGYFELEEEVNRQSAEYGRWIQQSLNRILGLSLAVDGIIGTYTRSAIRSFQQRQGLTADGIVGPITEAALIRAGASQPPQSSGPTPIYNPISPSIPNGRPVVGGRITSKFGPRLDPITKNVISDHKGVDIGGLPVGTRISCTASGRVTSAHYSTSAGNMVIVDHGGGYLTKYFHMNGLAVTVGQTVSRGQQVGGLGATGSRVTGPHLHYEVHLNGVAQNPEPFM